MPSQLALFLGFLFIVWLFARDRKLRPMTSGGVWVALLWIVMISSKPVSFWFGEGIQIEKPEDYLEGSPVDQTVFLLLIVIGLVVLWRRRVNWGTVFASNRWLFAFFLYCAISVTWSDYPFVSFKRWIKDAGNVMMVLIIFTEKDPLQAIKAVFARFAYFVIPLSVVFIKYFPDLGRYYNRWTWLPAYCGVTTEKNSLGCIVFICGLFLVWDSIEMRTWDGRRTEWHFGMDHPGLFGRLLKLAYGGVVFALVEAMINVDLLGRIALLSMVIWLLDKVNSATALVCLILGVGIVLFMQLPLARREVRHLGIYSLVICLSILLLYSIPGIQEAFVRMIGRETTLTGRTDLWTELLSEPIDPILGTGYQSFWLGPSAKRMWAEYYFHPNQAHNGYLETYLNGGLVGVFLLIAMIFSTGRSLKKELLLGGGYGVLCSSFLIVVVFYNWTEAVFNKLSPAWIILLIAALNSMRTHPRFPPGDMPGQ